MGDCKIDKGPHHCTLLDPATIHAISSLLAKETEKWNHENKIDSIIRKAEGVLAAKCD